MTEDSQDHLRQDNVRTRNIKKNKNIQYLNGKEMIIYKILYKKTQENYSLNNLQFYISKYLIFVQLLYYYMNLNIYYDITNENT